MNFEEKQEELNNLRKSELVFHPDIEIKDLADVVFNLLFLRRETFWKRNGKLYKQTTGILRSIEDCYLLAKYYFPNISYERVHFAVKANYHQKVNDPIFPYLGNSWCYTVKRMVHFVNGATPITAITVIREKLNKSNTNYTN